MKDKKVYCNDCRYMRYIINHEPVYNGGFYGCILSKYSPFTLWVDCKNKNKDGRCEDYKRKWWKIWGI